MLFKDPKFVGAVITVLAGIAAYFGLNIPQEVIGGVVGVIIGAIYGKQTVIAVKNKMSKKTEGKDV